MATMHLPDREAWAVLGSHLRSAHTSAPTHFSIMVAALVGDPTTIVAAQCAQVSEDDTTKWSGIVATKTLILDLEMTFHASDYTQDNDFDAYYQNHPVEITVDKATTRALSAITAINIESVGRYRATSPTEWIPILAASITFDDGTTLPMPSQDRLHRPEDRAASEALWAAIRAGSGLS